MLDEEPLIVHTANVFHYFYEEELNKRLFKTNNIGVLSKLFNHRLSL